MALPWPVVREVLRVPRWVLFVAPPALVLVAVVGLWAVDTALHGGKVARNVSLAGESVGGLGDDELRERVEALAETLDRVPILISTAAGSTEVTARQLGVSVDIDATVSNARDAGPGQPLDWLGSFTDDHVAQVVFDVDLDVAREWLQADRSLRTLPRDPEVVAADGRLELVPGSPGQGIDVEDVVAKLPDAVDRGGSPIRIDAELTTVDPRLTADDFAAALAEANATIANTLTLAVNEFQTELPADTVASWYRTTVSDEGDVTIELDVEAMMPDLEALLAPGATGGGMATFDVQDGEVKIVSSDGGTVCCADNAPFVVLRALRRGLGEEVHALPTRPAVPREGVEELEALGVVELVGEFTTPHACCQSRVTNIQRFADIMRGAVIMPGEAISLNQYVGRRTTENGFVPGGFISKGVLVSDIGGGVSQFATTIFNAAFFAGLDFDRYQAHSIYFTRYPYGREATISYPDPDLVIRNNTPYGVLIWTSYTSTSISVQMYSTKHIDVESLEPVTTFSGQCRRATTTRVRTYPDASEVRDSVFALYRPGEGLNCDGSASDPSLTTTTTAPPTTTTTVPADSSSTTSPPPPTTTTSTPPTTTSTPPTTSGG